MKAPTPQNGPPGGNPSVYASVANGPMTAWVPLEGASPRPAEGVEWRETHYEGVEWLPLSPLGENEGGGVTALIRMAPGCGYPAHRHLDHEDVWILEGGYRDEFGEYSAGTYLRYPPGSVHGPHALGRASEPTGPENPACLLFAVARGGVELIGPPQAKRTGSD